jgi:hypothetical protein
MDAQPDSPGKQREKKPPFAIEGSDVDKKEKQADGEINGEVNEKAFFLFDLFYRIPIYFVFHARQDLFPFINEDGEDPADPWSSPPPENEAKISNREIDFNTRR